MGRYLKMEHVGLLVDEERILDVPNKSHRLRELLSVWLIWRGSGPTFFVLPDFVE